MGTDNDIRCGMRSFEPIMTLTRFTVLIEQHCKRLFNRNYPITKFTYTQTTIQFMQHFVSLCCE